MEALEAPDIKKASNDDLDAEDFNAKKRSKTIGFRRKYNTSDPNSNKSDKERISDDIDDLDSGSNSLDDN